MSDTAMNRTALVLGATGAVGKQVLKSVLKDGKYEKVISVGRRNVELEDSIPQEKLIQKKVDFDNLEAHRQDFKGVDDVFCCLGTTRADAGGMENFIKIDQGYVLKSAKIIAEENKKSNDETALAPVHFLYCSSGGASKTSLFPYLKVKGQTEEALEETGFEKVSIFRPGFLQTVEPRTRPRLAESISLSIFNPINRVFGLGLVISVATVGQAMHKVAENTSIKPTDSADTKKSQIGSLVNLFTHADCKTIGGEPK